MKFSFLLLLFVSLYAKDLPTGFSITPDIDSSSTFVKLNPKLKSRPNYVAGQAVSIKLSPDKKTALILTSGFNRMFNKNGTLDINSSNEYVFIYDVAKNRLIQKQVIQIPNSFYGIAWHPKRDGFFVSGGVDDSVYYFQKQKNTYVKKNTIHLNHSKGLGVRVRPMAAEIALNSDGSLLAITNMENDSVSLIDTKKMSLIDELDLRPGKNNPKLKGVAGGEFPFGLAFVKNKLYVTSMRDYEVVVLRVDKKKHLKIIKRVKVGSQPTRVLYNNKNNELFVVNSRSDSISVIDTNKDVVKGSFYTTAPKNIFDKYHLKGANPNGLRLYKDTLYVTNGGTNSVAVIKLKRHNEKIAANVIALYPTGWYPNDLIIAHKTLYVVNAKSLSGSNIGDCRDNVSTLPNASKPCKGRNLYTFQTKKAGLLTMKLPKDEQKAKLTLQVAINNNFFKDDKKSKIIKFLHKKIKHIIYVVKENRSYDQVLGDLEVGNGDANLTLFPDVITPNHHSLAREFVTLDNFLDSGSASNDGWVWTTSGHTTEYTEKNIMINYAGRGLSYDNEGQNRNISLAFKEIKKRRLSDPRVPDDDDLMPGERDVASVDGDDEEAATGYIWNKALKAGLSVRNYGFYCDEKHYFLKHDDPAYVKASREPFKDKMIQAYPNKAALLDITDLYFHGYDNNYPDLWRFNEFKREFKNYVKSKKFPNLVLVRFPHDHFGSFKTALAKVNTPLRQIADDDYALGSLVELISKSPFADSTLIIAIEDDAQNGQDHVSSHRSICIFAGAYVKKHTVISTRYTTVNVLKTIESILDIDPIGLNDALAQPMVDVFDIKDSSFKYKAKVANILYKTELILPKKEKKSNNIIAGDHDKNYWQNVMKNQNFESEDKLDVEAFNQALWQGIMKNR